MSELTTVTTAAADGTRRPAACAATSADHADPSGLDFGTLLGAGIERIADASEQSDARAPAALQPQDPAIAAIIDPTAVPSALAQNSAPTDSAQIVLADTPVQAMVAALAAAPADNRGAVSTGTESRAGAMLPTRSTAAHGLPAGDNAAPAAKGALTAQAAGAEGLKAPRTATPNTTSDAPAMQVIQALLAERAATREKHADAGAPPAHTHTGNAHLTHTAHALHRLAEPAFAARVDSLPQPVGTPAWEDGFANRIVWMARSDVQTAEIRLNPPELGLIEVTLTLSGDHNSQASVQFSAAQATTRDAIESALPRLREMMQENGIALGQASVDAGQGGSTDPGGQSQSGARQGRMPGLATAEITPPLSPLPRRGDTGLVDTFA